MRRLFVLSMAALIALLADHCGARAELITFTSESAFQAATQPMGLESFETLADRAPVNSPLVTPSLVLTVLSPTSLLGVASSPDDGGRYATDGVKYVQFFPQPGNPSLALGTLKFVFSDPITSFGLSITDWGEQPNGPGTLQIRTDSGEASSPLTIAVNPPRQAEGNLKFFGFRQAIPFSVVELSSTTPNDGLGIDEVHLTAVPEPNSLISAALGLAALAGYAGWRRGRPARS